MKIHFEQVNEDACKGVNNDILQTNKQKVIYNEKAKIHLDIKFKRSLFYNSHISSNKHPWHLLSFETARCRAY